MRGPESATLFPASRSNSVGDCNQIAMRYTNYTMRLSTNAMALSFGSRLRISALAITSFSPDSMSSLHVRPSLQSQSAKSDHLQEKFVVSC
ncbi:hypothetical protein HBI68_217590 [Parastagonospora nodorum]|nr:hypothetical protein HBI51_218160 [Parastagonospora nodorum]KAH6141133.1 hypothetical protein HBI68_217590 [Parastagonospora nodorum]KAH6301236.1 hypothetical protein HBI39_121950 [Parastagonospora nodorum]